MRYLALTLCFVAAFAFGFSGETSASERGGEKVVTEHGHGGWGGGGWGHGGGGRGWGGGGWGHGGGWGGRGNGGGYYGGNY